MDYKKLLDKLKNYKKIVVAGPQRSGTTYCAHILAKDLEYELIDERDIAIASWTMFKQKIKNFKNIVIQCPELTYMLHEIPSMEERNIIVLVMKRKIEDIQSSEKRIGWGGFGGVKMRYQNYFHDKYDEKWWDKWKNNQSAELRYYFFENHQYQKMQVEHMYVPYEILEQTSEFKPKKERENFSPKQIK